MDERTQPDSSAPARGPRPAAPWRRLAASALDTVILLLWASLLFALAVGLDAERAAALPLALIGFASALAYMAVGWAVWGMTVGKWICGIRVVAADGGKLSWPRALARVPAFLIASAPLKIGFAAMLWDERRRGWHDRLAGTMVVRSSPGVCSTDGDDIPLAVESVIPGAAKRNAQSPAGNAQPVNALRSRLLALAMLAAYVLVALAVTMPLALHFSTHIPGAEVEGLEQDGYVFLWDYWWVREALTHPGLHVMTTRYLFWPEEVSLRYHTLVPLHSAAAALLQNVMSLIQTYNLLLLLSLAASAWGAFLLARYVTGSTAAGAVAGLAFGFCPYMTTHALAHQNLIAAEWLAPFAYFVLRGLRERRLRYLLGAAASWALVGLCEWYYFLYAGMLLGIFVVWEIAARPRRAAGALLAAAGVIALTVGALWPLLWPMLVERAHTGYMQQPLWRASALGGQAGLYLTPAFTNPVLGRMGARVLHDLSHSRAEATLYLGVVVIALALTGVAYRRRRACLEPFAACHSERSEESGLAQGKLREQVAPWIAGAVFFLVLALGPHLRIGDRTQFNALTLLLAGGLPGNGFDLPISAGLMSQLAMKIVAGSNFLATLTQVPLPYLWLWQYAPITRLAAVPTRAALPAMLCLAVLAAAGLAVVTQGLTRRWRWAIAGLAAGAILFEFMPVPYPMRDVRVPGFYRRLARCESRFAVAEVPLFGDHAIYMYYQTVHHKPIIAGLVSRRPPHALALVRGNALLRELQPQGMTPPGEPVLALTRWGALRRSLDELRAEYGPALAQVESNDVGIIIAHGSMLTRADMYAVDRVLHDALGLSSLQGGDGIVAYFPPKGAASNCLGATSRPGSERGPQ